MDFYNDAYPRPALADILSEVSTWLRAPEGGYVAAVEYRPDEFNQHHYTVAEITILDARLIPVLDAEIDRWAGWSNSPNGMLVAMSYAHWHNTYQPYPSAAGSKLFVKEIKRVAWDSTAETFHCILATYQVEPMLNGIDRVTGSWISNFWVPFDWFEAHYPGSVTRIIAALAVGVEPEDVVHYLSATAITVSAPLPDDIEPTMRF